MKTIRFIVLGWFVSLAFATGGFAQDQNCKNPQSQMEMNYCAYQDFLAADEELNDVYRLAINAVKRIDSYQEADQRGAEKALREAQRAWIVFRDNACEAEGYVAHGGTLEPLLIASCKARLTKQRAADLLWFSEVNG